MHFHGPIIRPQTDADSLFIEVTAGCTHNSCTYQIHPYYRMLTNVSVLPGTKLYEQMQRGEWTEATEKERVEEIRELIADLSIPITINSGTSTSSVVFEVALPKEKTEILHHLDRVIGQFNEKTEAALRCWRHSMLSV